MAIGPLSVAIAPTPSGRINLRHPDGNETAPDITIATIPNFTLTAGVTFSQNFNAYTSGSDLTGATYAIQAVTGTLGALDLSFSTSTLLGATPDVGAGVFYLEVTKSGYTFRSNNFSVTVNAATTTDTVAPVVPFGLAATNVTTTRNDITLDWPSDVRTGTVDPSDPVKIEIERSTDGGAFGALTTLTAGSNQPSPALTEYVIGSMTAPVSSQTDATLSLTCTDGVFGSTQDSMILRAGLVSGDFEIASEMPSISSDYQWTTSGPCVRQSTTPLCPAVTLAKRTASNPAGAPMLARASQGATLTWTADSLAPPGTPCKFVRTGNLWTFKTWDDAAKQWVTVGSQTVVMSDPVLAGWYLTKGTTGTPVSVTHNQCRINSLGTATHQDTTVTAGHIYGYRARARDSASPANLSDYGSTAFATTAAGSTNAIRIHPGHYMFLDGIIRRATAQSLTNTFRNQILANGNEPTIQGYKVFIQWSASEGDTLGNYGNPSTPGTGLWIVKTLRDACAQVGKRLWISWLHVQFGGYGAPGTWNSFFPQYIIDGASYGITTMTNGIIARVWQQATMDRVIAQVGAYADIYKDDPHMECMQIDETAIGVTPGVDGFSNANVSTQYKRWMTDMRTLAPNMGLRLTANFLGSDDTMADIIAYAANRDIMVGGPDTTPRGGIQANRIFSGTPPSAALGQSQSLPVVDYRGRVPWVGEVQSPTMNGSKGNYTAEQIFNAQMNGYTYNQTVNGVVNVVTQRPMYPQYMIWYAKEWAQPTGASLVGNPPPGGITWSGHILPFIRSINGAISSGTSSTRIAPSSVPCPSNYPACAFG